MFKTKSDFYNTWFCYPSYPFVIILGIFIYIKRNGFFEFLSELESEDDEDEIYELCNYFVNQNFLFWILLSLLFWIVIGYFFITATVNLI
jgi:hypothetical protein